MNKINDRIQLANDLIAITCNESEYWNKDKDIGDNAQNFCNESQSILDEVSLFLLGDPATKKEMALEWGADIEEASNAFWDPKISDMKQFSEKIKDQGVEAWYSVEEFGVKTAKWAMDSKVANKIKKWQAKN